MKRLLALTLLAVLAVCFTACSKDEDEPVAKCALTVDVYESIAAKGTEFYNPKAATYYRVMLFPVAASQIDKNSTEALANNTVLLTNGKTLAAAHVSDTGIITAEYGDYTLLVYLTGNPLNSYLERRFMYKDLKLNTSTSKENCCFVWDDMNTKGGFYPWNTK